jgi:hypothetical protein
MAAALKASQDTKGASGDRKHSVVKNQSTMNWFLVAGGLDGKSILYPFLALATE